MVKVSMHRVLEKWIRIVGVEFCLAIKSNFSIDERYIFDISFFKTQPMRGEIVLMENLLTLLGVVIAAYALYQTVKYERNRKARVRRENAPAKFESRASSIYKILFPHKVADVENTHKETSA